VVDGFEICFAWNAEVKFDHPGQGRTIRNCWIHDGGHGNPNWATNSDNGNDGPIYENVAPGGDGIHAPINNNTLIENNLIENNGATRGNGVGIYIQGTNNVIRNNVIRGNHYYGIQFNNDIPLTGSMNNRVYNNLIYGNGAGRGGRGIAILSSYPGGKYSFTNFVYNNTLIGYSNRAEVVTSQYGVLWFTNNIVLGDYPYGLLIGINGGTIIADYNLSTNTLVESGVSAGSHNIVTRSAGFVSPSRGLYWLASGNAARGSAQSNVCGPVDFFGNSQSSVADIGFNQYSAPQAADSRTLDPSTSAPNGLPDYWAPAAGQ
jgi:hypothetical protein